MKCPYCQHSELKVTDSRDAPELNAIRRRRECLGCLKRFTTFETVELTLQVLKRDGRYEEFDEKKFIEGIETASRHTSISHQDVIKIATELTNQLRNGHAREITTTEIGNFVMEKLRVMDPIAYIRFACVYRRFKNVDEFREAIAQIEAKDEH